MTLFIVPSTGESCCPRFLRFGTLELLMGSASFLQQARSWYTWLTKEAYGSTLGVFKSI